MISLFSAHQAVMTSAVFAPRPSLFFKHAAAASAASVSDNTQSEAHVTSSTRHKYNITGKSCCLCTKLAVVFMIWTTEWQV